MQSPANVTELTASQIGKGSVTVGNTIEEMEIVLTLEPENDASVDISKCSLTFEPPYDLLYDGTPKTAAVSLMYRENYYLEEGTDYSVAYDDNVNAGLVTVTISGSGFFTGSIEQTFTIEKAGQALNVLSGDFYLSVGQTDQIFVSGIGEISYSSGNTSIAVVDEKGLVTGVSDGETTIRATAAGNNNYSGDSVEFSVIVYSLSSDPDYDYSTPDTDKEDGIETEAEIKQSENSDSTQTETTVKLSVCALKSFTNTAKGITIKWKKVTNASGYYIYRKTGTESYKRISTIKNGSTVSYTDKSVKNINGTTYTYKIVPYSENSTGIGTVKTFVRLTGSKLTSVKNSSSKKATVKWKKTTKVSGYQIQYSTSKTFAKGNKAIKVSGAKKTSKILTGLKKGKTYYVRIRTYKKVNGKTYYSAWSSKMKVKIGK
ncbi:MAG: Ig-like domain-containing protein [Clostridiales bacterium]|nr:Ig-like domain-containing protein [Clostridiales bacterium]